MQLNNENFLAVAHKYSSFVDKTGFTSRIVKFMPGFANTQYYAYKKTMQTAMHFFYTFAALDNIEIVIPAVKESFEKNTYTREDYLYVTLMHRKSLEDYLGVSFDDLNNQEQYNALLNEARINHKSFILMFGSQYVRAIKEP